MTRVDAIDKAAGGYVRLRFVRAISASLIVALSLGFVLWFLSWKADALGHTTLDQFAQNVGLAVAAFLTGLVSYFVPAAVVVIVTGALIDLLHRRLIGAALLGFSLWVLFYATTTTLAALLVFGGMSIEISSGPMTVAQATRFGFLGIFAGLIAYELARHAWWQLTASAEGFCAVRGWRPPPWRLLTTLRRHLGLPGFISYVGRKRVLVTFLYLGVAALNLGFLMAFTIPMALRPGFEHEQRGPEDIEPYAGLAVMASLLLLNLCGAGAILTRRADARTTKLYQGVREWDARAPIVFLRAFDQDDERLRAWSGDAFARWPAGVGRSRTLDEILLENGSPYGPVIAIGDPRDPTPPLGAARVFVQSRDEAWKDVVSDLVHASQAVVMCPNDTEGVQWELDLLTQEHGRLRVIFLASPELTPDRSLALFERVAPPGAGALALKPKQIPIAAFDQPGLGWRVLTAKRLSVETYTTALNIGLQALFGQAGEPLTRPKAERR